MVQYIFKENINYNIIFKIIPNSKTDLTNVSNNIIFQRYNSPSLDFHKIYENSF